MAVETKKCYLSKISNILWYKFYFSQPACLHDLLWCFVAALEANTTSASNGSNMNDDKAAKDKKNKKMAEQKAASSEGLFDHPTEDITIAGRVHIFPCRGPPSGGGGGHP